MNQSNGNGTRLERWISELLASWRGDGNRRGNGNRQAGTSYRTARETEREAMTRLYGERHETVVVSPSGNREGAAEDTPDDELPAGTA